MRTEYKRYIIECGKIVTKSSNYYYLMEQLLW